MCVCVFVICAQNALSRCLLLAMHLSGSVVFGQGALRVCVHLCVFFLIIFALNALSICAVFRQCTCQDVSSFNSAPVKMCRLWAGGLVCVCVLSLVVTSGGGVFSCVCVAPFTPPPGVICMQLVLVTALCVCVCVCLLHYLCPKSIVKMCHLLTMQLSRCVIFGQGVVCVCVHVCVLFLFTLNAFSSKMCRLWAGGLVCVCVFSPLFLP